MTNQIEHLKLRVCPLPSFTIEDASRLPVYRVWWGYRITLEGFDDFRFGEEGSGTSKVFKIADNCRQAVTFRILLQMGYVELLSTKG